MEVKYRSEKLGTNKCSDLGKTVWITLKIREHPFGTGKDVVFESGFCVTKGIMALEERGVYTGAIINKRKYCPKGVPGDEIDQNLHNRYVGDVDMLESMTE